MRIEHGFLVTGDNAREVYRLLLHGASAMRRNGVPLSLVQSNSIREIGLIALSGHGDVPVRSDLKECPPEPISEPLSTVQVAEMLGVCPRQARRYAETLAARRVGHRLIWDKSEVLEYLEGKEHG